MKILLLRLEITENLFLYFQPFILVLYPLFFHKTVIINFPFENEMRNEYSKISI